MAEWTLADIRSKVRSTTGRPSTGMMSNTTLDDYINKFYQYVLLKELKISWGYTYYQFFTEPNVDQYVGPTTSFQFNVSAYPILPGSLYVTDGSQVAQDDGAGGFLSPATGAIDYTTGAVSITFSVAPSANANISATSQTYMANRPQSILYFKSAPLDSATQSARNDQKYFVLRPVPDDVYLIKMQGIQIPPSLTNTTDVPFRSDLGPLIAYGASLEIFADFNQMDQYDQIMTQYNRYKDVCMQDTYEMYLYQRSVPAF